MKIGGSEGHRSLGSAEEIKAWFRGPGAPAERDRLWAKIRDAIPYLQSLPDDRVTLDTCAVSKTPNEMPYIDMVDDRVGVATGGKRVGGEVGGRDWEVGGFDFVGWGVGVGFGCGVVSGEGDQLGRVWPIDRAWATPRSTLQLHTG